jgi:hypothetical protein
MIAATDSVRLPRKIEPLPGCLSATYQRCGKAVCRCTEGQKHGPYWSRFWRERGRRRRQYVRHADLEHVRAGIAAWRRLHPPARSARDAISEIRRLLAELKG